MCLWYLPPGSLGLFYAPKSDVSNLPTKGHTEPWAIHRYFLQKFPTSAGCETKLKELSCDLISPLSLTCTVDGWNPAPVGVGSLSHYSQGFILTCQVVGLGISEPSTVSRGTCWTLAVCSLSNLSIPPKALYNPYVLGTWWYKFRVISQRYPHVPFELTHLA